MIKEMRHLQATELRVDGEADAPKIVGYAAVFNTLSGDLGGFREKIAAGAFAKPISEGQDVRALVDHDSRSVIGRTTNGTLTMKEDKRGLLVTIEPPDTTLGKDTVASIKRGDISGMSFAFTTESDEWNIEGGDEVRTLTGVKQLFDVGPVTYPAYEQTSVGVRSVMAQAGLDDAALARVLVRHEHGRALSPDDVALVRSAVARLEAVLPLADEVPTMEELRDRLKNL